MTITERDRTVGLALYLLVALLLVFIYSVANTWETVPGEEVFGVMVPYVWYFLGAVACAVTLMMIGLRCCSRAAIKDRLARQSTEGQSDGK